MSTKPTAYTGHDPYIFVSYAHKDRARVFPYIEALQARYNVWFDEGIRFGKEWDGEIADRLMGCRVFLCFLTEAALDSSDCKDELTLARDEQKPMANLLPDRDLELPNVFKLRFGRYPMCYLDQFNTPQDAITALATRIPEMGDAVK